MKKIFITGSTTGLGLMAGKLLMEQGHKVVLHARSEKSKKETSATLKDEVPFVVGDVSNLDEMKSVAEQANQLGPFDAIIHNVGIYDTNADVLTKEGLRALFAVNVLAPYVLSTHIKKTERMIFLSSGMHTSGSADLSDPQWKNRNWNSTQAYCDSKLFDLMLVKYFARKRPEAFINAVDPGWVRTRMGGPGAPVDLKKGSETQAWLSVSNDPAALVSGKYFHHLNQQKYNPQADNEAAQEKLIGYLEEISGEKKPGRL